jgi:hypothetical protein
MNKKMALVEFERGDFKSAERILKTELRNNPADLSSQLYLGLCKLFLNDEKAFKRIHDAVARKLARLESIPAHLAALWSEYKRQFLKITATALVLGGPLSVTGCQHTRHDTYLYGLPALMQPTPHRARNRVAAEYGNPAWMQLDAAPKPKHLVTPRKYQHTASPDSKEKQPSQPVTEPQPKAIPQTDSGQSKP